MAAEDTIFSLSSAAGRAGVAVLRISGPGAGAALDALAGTRPPARRASLRRLSDPRTGEALDRGLVLWFPGPASFTGEDMVELHLHGGRAVVAAAIEGLNAINGLRPADAGEFTRRAFDNGKLDLSEIEGLADLIDAETEAQRRQALRQMDGALSRQTESWRERLISALARVEAAIDFPDEDIPKETLDAEHHNILSIEKEITQYLGDNRRGERLREGLRLVILGAPNVGKSSFLNALAQRDAAIVSATAGTTRDVIEVHLDLAGYPVTLADTAGLRQAREATAAGAAEINAGQNSIEAEGMRRARAHAAAADLKLVVFDACGAPNFDEESLSLLDEDSLVLLNKSDLVPQAKLTSVAGHEAMSVSAKTGAGMAELLDRLTIEAARRLGGGSSAISRARQRRALEDCAAALERTHSVALPELIAEDLRLAVRSLGRITGRVDVEEILDIIFRDFCIGK